MKKSTAEASVTKDGTCPESHDEELSTAEMSRQLSPGSCLEGNLTCVSSLLLLLYVQGILKKCSVLLTP